MGPIWTSTGLKIKRTRFISGPSPGSTALLQKSEAWASRHRQAIEHALHLGRGPLALASRGWDALIVQASCNSPQ